MPRGATKAAENVYCQARYRAAEHDARLCSRESAAEQLYCGRDVIAKVELDVVRPGPELVAMMSDVYDAPELLSHYCSQECSIGKRRRMKAVGELPVTQITIKVLSGLKDIHKMTDRLLDIVEDGVIDQTEMPDILEIIGTLDRFAQMRDELLVKIEKRSNKKAAR